ncbi:MAG: DUF1189 family protein [Elusimicrobia bacterium]|nr:DUF1189 family protein [Elusimicrobiota bacterium]
MIPDLLDALARPASYRRFSAEKASRAAAYVAFLSLIFMGSIGIAVKLRLAPLFAETFTWLETSMPAVTFANGTVTSTAAAPLRLEHPRMKEVALMIDTTRKDPVTAQQMTDAKVLAYLTSNALYLKRGEDDKAEVETIDLAKSTSDRPVTVDANAYKDMENAFDWVFYPALMLFFFLTFAASLAFCGLLYALVGMLVASSGGKSLPFSALFRIALHAQTAGSLLYALDALLPRAIPFFQMGSIGLTLAYLWYGVRAAALPEAPAPAA